MSPQSGAMKRDFALRPAHGIVAALLG